MSVRLTTRKTGGVVIVEMSGSVTLGAGSSTLRRGIRELVESGQRQIVLDMAEVDYMDSSGIGELLSSHTIALSAGGDVKLLNVSRRVRELLETMRIDVVFEMFNDEALAVASFTSGIVDEAQFGN